MAITPPDAVVALLLAVAAALAMWRLRRARASLLVAQAVCAVLLGLTLRPPPMPPGDGTLTVWTPGATPSRWRDVLWPTRAVALPGSTAAPELDRAPDLATALRRDASTRRLVIVGDGLAPRDQAAAASVPLRFDAAPVHGLVALQAPTVAQVGSAWSLDGRAAAPAVRAELRDPAGAVIDAVAVRDGRFRLSGAARAAGALRFELRLLDAAGHVSDTASVPLQALPGEPLTVIVRAGGPDPDTKYWRRWAADAGMQVRFAAALGPDMATRDGDTALTPTNLAAADLVVIDDRAWAALAPGDSAALQAAVRDGLGLVLRCSGGPLDARVAADWSALGWTLQTAEADAAPVTLDRRLGLRLDAAEHLTLTAAPVQIVADAGATPLVRSDAGDLLAAVRGSGAGRVMLWRLVDSYRLQLAGEAARYGRLWGDALAQTARERPAADAVPGPLPGDRWVSEPTTLCGLVEGASVDAPGWPARALLVDGSGCAADVPMRPGWHRVLGGGMARPFFVRDADDGAGLRRGRDRAATERLANRGIDVATASPPATTPPRPMPRWPFCLAWALSFAWILWRENALRR